MINDITQQSQPNKRQSCSHCLRPQKTCLCNYIQVTNNHIELIILQHPMEVHEAKNTARLLHLCLNNSQLYVGEQFDDSFFMEFKSHSSDTPKYDVLLYPETLEEKSLGILSPPTLDINRFAIDDNLSNIHAHNKSNNIRLWVLDATWRKSRKMLYLNHHLQTMPRLKLINCAPTIYTIRKAHSQNQLSTLEASCYALQQLEHNLVNYNPVLQAFADFIAQQKTFFPTSHS